MDPVYSELRACAAVLYDSRSTNQQRRDAYQRVEAGIAEHPDAQAIAVAAMAMLQESDLPPEHLGFAASIISDLLRQGRVTCDSIPYSGMAQFLGSTRVHAVTVSGITNVLAQCALQLWPDQWIDMLDTLCPEDLIAHPELCIALDAVTSALIDTDPGAMPKGRFSVIRKGLEAAAPVLMMRVVNAVGGIVTGTSTVFGEQGYVGPPLQATLSQLLQVVERVIPFLPTALWWDSYLHDLVCTLLVQESVELALHAANIFSALVAAASTQTRASVWSDFLGAQLISNVLGHLAAVAKLETWESVDVLLTAIQSLPESDIQRIAQPIFDMINTVILEIPSIKFTALSCELLLVVLPIAVNEGAAVDAILHRLKSRSRKFVAHPELGWDESSTFSAEQYATVEEFETSFAYFRSLSGKVFLLIAQLAPEAATNFVADAIQSLPSPSNRDPRNRFGHVDQKSPTYVDWEATFFAAENSQPAISDVRAVQAVQNCFNVCFDISRSVTDATLVPVLLNLLASLWTSASNDHWSNTLDMLFHFMALEPTGSSTSHNAISSDPDVVSARRRAATLLIRACSEFGPVVAPFADQIVQHVQSLLISTSTPLLPAEVPMLYEAVAALSNVMTSDEQQTFLGSLVNNHVETFNRIAGPITPNGLALMLCSPANEARDDRQDFRTASGIIAAVLRRCSAQSPIAYEMAYNLQNTFTKTLICFFQVQPFLPQRHARIFDLDPAERQALATTGNQRPPANTHDPVTSCAVGIRSNLYSGIAAMLKILNTIPQIFSDLCDLLVPRDDQPLMPTHLVKQMCTQCLFEAISVFPQCVLQVLPPLGAYIEAHSSVVRPERDDVVDAKLISTIYRVCAAVIKKAIIEANPEVSLMNDPNVVACIVQFYHAIARSGYELKTLTYDLLPFCQRPDDQYAIETVATLVGSVRLARVDVVQRRFVLEKMSDLYMKHFPRYVTVFEVLGASTDDVERLHSGLMSAARPDLKRRRFVEFVGGLFGVGI